MALAPRDGTDPDDLLRKADVALYASKSAGRNAYRIFDPQMLASTELRDQLELEVRAGAARWRGPSSRWHFQPIVRCEAARVRRTIEALVRWPVSRRRRADARPAAFVPDWPRRLRPDRARSATGCMRHGLPASASELMRAGVELDRVAVNRLGGTSCEQREAGGGTIVACAAARGGPAGRSELESRESPSSRCSAVTADCHRAHAAATAGACRRTAWRWTTSAPAIRR